MTPSVVSPRQVPSDVPRYFARRRVSATPCEDALEGPANVAAKYLNDSCASVSHRPRRRLVGETTAIRRLLDQVARVAAKNVTVLIEGETGTGKELVARAIHEASPRGERPFVAVNCAELTTDAAESRLFGHRRGSFTGAIDEHKGFFEVADRTTLFLDEVGELDLAIQAKLLRVLQEGEIVRFGDSRPRRIDVRLVAATNRELHEEVKAGRFREDLLYRLRVVPIRVPPLRERPDDVRPLAEHFIAVHARNLGMTPPRLTSDALRALQAYDFPGNVRDLENAIIRALVLCESDGVIGVADLPGIQSKATCGRMPADVTARAPAADADESLVAAMARYERSRIESALEAAGGNRTRAARALGISRRWLIKKVERYAIAAVSGGRLEC